ncbi:MAG: glycosyltransferase family 2 protein [Paludibacter sp.]|nr:glycosyltransferase family 2 protein [Paludibacter sp.]
MFSVVIPLYNKAPYIEKAIRSVANQTFQNFELIIIDDGSTDDSLNKTKEILHTLTPPIWQCSVLSQKNAGVSTTRNNGVKYSKYNYIAFLDADDWWDIRFLEEMNDLIHEFPGKGVYGSGIYTVKRNNNRIIDLGVDPSFIKGIANYSNLLSKGYTRPVCTGSCVISKKTFNDVGGFHPDLKMGEDFDLFFKCYLKNGLVLLNKPLFYYNQNVDPANRAISNKLYSRKESVFFNLNYPEQEYDKDVRHLIEFLKLRSFYPYFLAGIYIDEIKKELKQINFSNHLAKFFWQYKVLPRWIQNFWYFVKRNIYHLLKRFL